MTGLPSRPQRDLIADAARALRESLPAGALAMMVGSGSAIGSTVREHYRRVNALQAATMRALVLANNPADPEAVRRVADEAARRSPLMGEVNAWESVADDLKNGRWRP